MTDLTLEAAQTIIAAGLKHARSASMKPLGMVVLDARGALKAYAAEDKTSLKRYEIAHGKAYGCLAVGQGSRNLNKMVTERPHFGAALAHVVGGTFIPVPGGALIRVPATLSAQSASRVIRRITTRRPASPASRRRGSQRMWGRSDG